ncbi:hypothetical protein LPJ59_004815 [Coemansia sp. RSA 2399]|nr:hypothetical protein LPJ59_004815 [Coemansia sp. RSA 2399]
MVLAEELEAKLKNNLAAEAVVRVVDKSGGCGSSFDLFIVSDEFDKVPLLKRHRKIHDMLEDEMPSIHALTMKLYTVAQYEKVKEKEEAVKEDMQSLVGKDADAAANQNDPSA